MNYKYFSSTKDLKIMSAAALILSTAAAAAGAIGSAVNRKNARDRALNYLNSEYYRDPLSTIGNRAILKSFDERMKDQQEAMNNRATAGGATMENRLAMKKSSNEVTSGLYSKLLQGEDARRQAIQNQRESVIQNGYLQAAQDWQSWGAAASQAAMQWGNSQLLNTGGAQPAFDPDEYIRRNNLKTYTV